MSFAENTGTCARVDGESLTAMVHKTFDTNEVGLCKNTCKVSRDTCTAYQFTPRAATVE